MPKRIPLLIYQQIKSSKKPAMLYRSSPTVKGAALIEEELNSLAAHLNKLALPNIKDLRVQSVDLQNNPPSKDLFYIGFDPADNFYLLLPSRLAGLGAISVLSNQKGPEQWLIAIRKSQVVEFLRHSYIEVQRNFNLAEALAIISGDTIWQFLSQLASWKELHVTSWQYYAMEMAFPFGLSVVAGVFHFLAQIIMHYAQFSMRPSPEQLKAMLKKTLALMVKTTLSVGFWEAGSHVSDALTAALDLVPHIKISAIGAAIILTIIVGIFQGIGALMADALIERVTYKRWQKNHQQRFCLFLEGFFYGTLWNLASFIKLTSPMLTIAISLLTNIVESGANYAIWRKIESYRTDKLLAPGRQGCFGKSAASTQEVKLVGSNPGTAPA